MPTLVPLPTQSSGLPWPTAERPTGDPLAGTDETADRRPEAVDRAPMLWWSTAKSFAHAAVGILDVGTAAEDLVDSGTSHVIETRLGWSTDATAPEARFDWRARVVAGLAAR